MIVEAHHICHLYISQCDVDCWNSQSQNRNVMLTKLTTCPDINRLPIRLLLQHLRGKVSGGAGKTWVTNFIQWLFWQNTGILEILENNRKGIQGCRQNLSYKFHSVIFLGRILEYWNRGGVQMGIFSMNLHQFRFASMFTSIGMFFCLVGFFISVVVYIALTHQTKPVVVV